MMTSAAEVGWGGRDAAPAEGGGGVDVGEVEAEEMTQWATSVTDDQEVVPVVAVQERVWCQPGGSFGEDGPLLPVSGGNKRGSAVAVTEAILSYTDYNYNKPRSFEMPVAEAPNNR
jgi:hypothetical protein